jgi:hypothetical protein
VGVVGGVWNLSKAWEARAHTFVAFLVLACVAMLLGLRDWDDSAVPVTIAGAALVCYGAVARARGLAVVLVFAAILIMGIITTRDAHAEYDACRAAGTDHCEEGLVEIGIAVTLFLSLAAVGLGIILGEAIRRFRAPKP